MDAPSCYRRRAVVARCAVLALWLIVLTSPRTRATTIRVPSDEPTIQAGIDASASGDTVLVAPGTYVGPGNRDIRFGGRGVVVRSESGADETVIDCQGSPGDPHRGFHFFEGEPPNARVEGLTIRDGYATNQLGNDGGGAILCELNSSPVIERCKFEGNAAEGPGGALSVLESGVVVRECAFEENGHETIDGGAAYCWDSQLLLEDCGFEANRADEGGAVAIAFFSYAEVRRCVFAHNLAVNQGAAGSGVILVNAKARVESCTFAGNQTGVAGFTVYLEPRNQGWYRSYFERNIIVNASGSGLGCAGNVDHACNDVWNSGIRNYFGCVSGLNLSLDPMFCNATAGDYHLLPESPCAPDNSPAGCGLIGAWPVGCETTGTTSWSPAAASARVAVRANPVAGSAEFDVEGVRRQLTLEIYDPRGRLLSRLEVGGSRRVTWPIAPGMPAGVYLARLAGERAAPVKFVVIR